MTYQDFPDNRGRGRPAKYPLASLSVGETVFLPDTETRLVGKAAQTRRPMQFKCKAVVKGGVKGVRVRRIV